MLAFALEPMDFKKHHGKLLSVISNDVDQGLLSVLVQFYDSLYRYFTFPNYHLMPILEEYAHLLGIPVSDKYLLVDWRRVPDPIS